MKLNSLQLRVPPTEGRDVSPSRQKRKNPRIPSINKASVPQASVLLKGGTVSPFLTCADTKTNVVVNVVLFPLRRCIRSSARSYRAHSLGDCIVGNFVAKGDDQRVDGVNKSTAQRQQTDLLPAQHPAVQPVGETPGIGKDELRALENTTYASKI